MSTAKIKSDNANAVLGIAPPLIRESLLNIPQFIDDFNLDNETTLVFGEGEFSVHRSIFFDAVRTILSGTGETEVLDTKGRVWRLMNEADKDATPILVILSNELHLKLPNFNVLSHDVALRIRALENCALKVNLPTDDLENWRCILQERALEDYEIEAFHSDLHNTPVFFEQTILRAIMEGKREVSDLVPNSLRYFQRLVGAYDESNSISEFATSTGKLLFEHLSKWQPYEGFLYSLLLSSHSAFTAEIIAHHLDKDKLVKAYEFVESHGDMLSRLGAFEVGLRILPERPEIEKYLLRLVNRIRDDDVDGDVSEFELFSALFILVDGELSRTRLMAEEPPFYRRLASLAQAALLHRQLVQWEIKIEKISQWAFDNCSEQFYMQSLADMRAEPRWSPDLAVASQLKEEFLGRIIIAGINFEENIRSSELYDTILGNGKLSVTQFCKFPLPYLAGPLEGAEDSPSPLPIELARVIEQALDTDEIEVSSFSGLVNTSMIYRIKPDHAVLAAKALILANHRLANLEDESQLVGILHGLATVAAISRTPSLASELQILVRRYLRDLEFNISVEKAMQICLVAAAAHDELTKWREFAGEWLTELAFSEMEIGEAEVLHSRLIALLHSVPVLWNSCAKADAALKALCSS